MHSKADDISIVSRDHHILTYNDRTVTHPHIKWGVALGPIVVGAGTRHFPPFPDTCPRNQPALGQTYATVVFGKGRVSGEQMLTVGRGLWTTATAAVHKALFQLTHCQDSVLLQTVAAANNTSVVSTSQLCDIRSQGRARSARYKDGCLAAEPLVNVILAEWTKIVSIHRQSFHCPHLLRAKSTDNGGSPSPRHRVRRS